MHYLVRHIIAADNADEANNEVYRTMENLIEWREFDWFHDTANESRWEDCWKPVRLSDKQAQGWVQEAMQGQLAEFKDSLATIRLMLEGYTDEQIFNEEFKQVGGHYLSRYQFSRASGYHANACQLFGEGGVSITSQKQLEWYLKDAAKLWVVQVDCHN